MDQNGEIKLYKSTTNSADHRTYYSKDEPDREFQSVQCITLDDYAENNNIIDKINFIKMDIQGNEYSAIKGMKKIIEKNKKLSIITEFCPYFLAQVGLKNEEFLNLLLLCLQP